MCIRDSHEVKKQFCSSGGYELKSIWGGYLVQTADVKTVGKESSVVTKKQLGDNQLQELQFAETVAKNVKSNAIVFTKNMQTIGIGAGQMSRVDSTKLAAKKANDQGFELSNAVAASDAFFPFRDGIDEIAKVGIKAVIQPGGSVRDDEAITAANEHDMVMVFSNYRHFRH